VVIVLKERLSRHWKGINQETEEGRGKNETYGTSNYKVPMSKPVHTVQSKYRRTQNPNKHKLQSDINIIFGTASANKHLNSPT
jgi:hypothetical protein